ncbi:uncharacterized protein LOC113549665 isoform X1 [Rhopalosiphum maidis]|uniref:uncharacterized protein LOC113549665 isoform X1 n=2 Tax=Rhopalosiphum maidis TaxID=43146 RepID=UPI000F003505|nr:uncharacterized protein LOC113549665 isoform X1 [Rhopalosiphum maidis]
MTNYVATMEEKAEFQLKEGCRLKGNSCCALKHAVRSLTNLDDFVSERIGEGFFSEVYRVTHRTTGKVMVLKMNIKQSNRFNMLKEVQLMNKLSHPNILGFEGACVYKGQLHALTEYINGGSLEQLLESDIDLSFKVRMKISLDIARGMKYLHSRDIFHRDLTSKNVLIKKNESIKDLTAVVADFGLAAKIPKKGQRLQQVGSPWWMSPECVKGNVYNESSDVFSYGIVLCEIIARVKADPDILPRTQNFGLDYIAFVELCSSCPPPTMFLKLAFSCCHLDAKSRPTFKEIVQQLEEAIAFPLTVSSNLSGSRRCPVVTTRSNPCSTAMVEARSEEFLLQNNGPEENNHKKLCHSRSLSEDEGILAFPAHTAPSDKARCHFVQPLRYVGESMCRQDPHYKPCPSKSNPFHKLDAKFQGVRKILASTNGSDLFSSCCELPSPGYVELDRRCSLSVSSGSTLIADSSTPKGKLRNIDKSSKKCRSTSLPTSPLMSRASGRRWMSLTNIENTTKTFPTVTVDSCWTDLTIPVNSGVANLRRRGSCESGFYSSVCDDFCLPGLECQHTTNASSVTLSSGSATSSLFLDSTGDEHHLRPGGYCFLHNNTHHSSEDLSTCNEWESHQKTRHISKIVEYFEEKQSQRETQPSIRPRRSGLVSGVLRRAINTTSPNVCGKRILVCEGAVRSKLKLFDRK